MLFFLDILSGYAYIPIMINNIANKGILPLFFKEDSMNFRKKLFLFYGYESVNLNSGGIHEK